MTALLDNRIYFTYTIKIYPDPELEKLNTQSDVKDIDLKEKILELKVSIGYMYLNQICFTN